MRSILPSCSRTFRALRIVVLLTKNSLAKLVSLGSWLPGSRARSVISLSMHCLACSWSFVRVIVPSDRTKAVQKSKQDPTLFFQLRGEKVAPSGHYKHLKSRTWPPEQRQLFLSNSPLPLGESRAVWNRCFVQIVLVGVELTLERTRHRKD